MLGGGRPKAPRESSAGGGGRAKNAGVGLGVTGPELPLAGAGGFPVTASRSDGRSHCSS
jgi:hypothetical protein